MKIKSLYVDGYKNIVDTRLCLDGINAVLSVNNYGKSNLLEAFDFATDYIRANQRQRISMMSYIKGIPLNPHVDSKPFSFEIVFEDDSLGEYKEVKYSFSFIWIRDDKSGCRIIDEQIETRDSTSKRYTSFLKRAEGKYRKSKYTTAYRKLNLDETQLAIDVLGSIDDIDIYPVIKAINSINFRICDSLDVSDRFSLNPIEYIGSRQSEVIAFDDDDVPRALYRLKESSPDRFELFCDAIYELFPSFVGVSVDAYEIKDRQIKLVTLNSPDGDAAPESSAENIPFKIKDEIYRVLIKSEHINQPVNLSMMSTGTKRLFWLLTNVFVASCNHLSVIGIEELETSIHPRLMKQLLEILNEESGDTSIIISSHSPFLIQYLKPERIYLGKSNNTGVATFKKIQRKNVPLLVEKAYGNGLTVGEYIFELMSGDNDSSMILNAYLED